MHLHRTSVGKDRTSIAAPINRRLES
jgi:hypothetical protein